MYRCVLLCDRNSTLSSLLSRNVTREIYYQDWANLKLDTKSFKTGSNSKGYPKFQANAGRENGLTFVINMEDEGMACPQYESEGARVSIIKLIFIIKSPLLFSCTQ
jgi:hypothetical protein